MPASCRSSHIIIEHSDQLEVTCLPVHVHDAVPLLGHEQEEGVAQFGINQRLPQTLTRLLSVAHLPIVSSLYKVVCGCNIVQERQIEVLQFQFQVSLATGKFVRTTQVLIVTRLHVDG